MLLLVRVVGRVVDPIAMAMCPEPVTEVSEPGEKDRERAGKDEANR